MKIFHSLKQVAPVLATHSRWQIEGASRNCWKKWALLWLC